QNGHEQLQAKRTGKTLQVKNRHCSQDGLIEQSPCPMSTESSSRSRPPPRGSAQIAAAFCRTARRARSELDVRFPDRNECGTPTDRRPSGAAQRTAAERGKVPSSR